MRPFDLLGLGVAALAGGLLALLLGGGGLAVVIGMVLGALSAFLVIRLGIRVAVAVPVLLGTVAGAAIGRNVVRVICLPDRCPSLEVGAAVLAALGAFIGIGLVVALVARSFDEYWEATAKQQPPPEPDGESNEGVAE